MDNKTLQTKILELVSQIAASQKEKVLQMGRRIVPNLTDEDALQPNDFPELESHPLFRYEEGALEGVKTVEAALLTLFKESSSAK